jgi:hypothetical protein
MATRKMPVVWSTGIGGAGVSVFYSPFGVDMTTELATFFNAIKSNFPNAVTWDIPGSGDVIDETTGLITGAWTAGTAATITATGGTGSYVAGTGAFVRWQTNGIVNGRRVRGRTFLDPLVVGAFDANGTIATAALGGLQPAATALAASGKMLIWHRPTPGGADGSTHAVVAGTVPDKVSSLRTRRT